MQQGSNDSHQNGHRRFPDNETIRHLRLIWLVLCWHGGRALGLGLDAARYWWRDQYAAQIHGRLALYEVNCLRSALFHTFRQLLRHLFR